jgi:hypothetical protein
MFLTLHARDTTRPGPGLIHTNQYPPPPLSSYPLPPGGGGGGRSSYFFRPSSSSRFSVFSSSITAVCASMTSTPVS